MRRTSRFFFPPGNKISQPLCWTGSVWELLAKWTNFFESQWEKEETGEGAMGHMKEDRSTDYPKTTLVCQFLWCSGDAWTLGGRWKYKRKKIQRERLMSPESSREHVGLLFEPGGRTGIWEGLIFSPREYNFLNVSNKYFLCQAGTAA